GRVDGFVQSVGTGGSFCGNAEGPRKRNPKIQTGSVEPTESPGFFRGGPAAHKIDGVGARVVGAHARAGVADSIERVSTAEGTAMALRLAREEGLFCGTSTGCNVVAALHLAERSGPEATIVTILCDTGMKYLKTFGAELSKAEAAR